MITVSPRSCTGTVIALTRSIRRQPSSGTRFSSAIPSCWIRSSWLSPPEVAGPEGGVVVTGETPDIDGDSALLVLAVGTVVAGVRVVVARVTRGHDVFVVDRV